MSETPKSRPVPAAEIARFATPLEFTDLPETAIRKAEEAVVDTVGVMYAGATRGAGRVAGDVVRELTAGSTGAVRVLGRDFRASLTDAMVANGTAGHCLDWDDFTMYIPGHPSVTTIPAILGLADIDRVTGRKAITATVLGWQVQCFLGSPIVPGHHDTGWHSTATLGVFSAAAATAYLLDLDERQFTQAMNMAASMPAGLLRMHGTMTKPLHVGQALRSGVTVALLAQRGFTADENAIGGEDGYFDRYSGPEGPDFGAMASVDDGWAIVEKGVNVKKYPSCGFTHTIIEAAEQLSERNAIEAEDVASVTVSGSELARKALQYPDPESGDQAKFSAEYTAASGIVRDRTGIEAFDDDRIDDSRVQGVRERVSWETDPELPEGTNSATVRIETTAGSIHSKRIDDPPGHPDNPLSREEFREKFLMAASMALDEDEASTLYERLDSLRQVDDVAAILP